MTNGGSGSGPRVGRVVGSRLGSNLRGIFAKSVRKLEIPPEVRDPIMQGLSGVTTDGRGTAVGAFAGFPSQTFPVSGKTGTAQAGDKQDTTLFVACRPTSNPLFIVRVVMEDAG